MSDKKPLDMTERYYSRGSLGKWFAAASILLLFCLLAVLHFDYHREWRKYQQEFRRLEAEKTRALYQDKSEELKSNSAYQTVLQQLSEAEAGLKAKQADYKQAQKALRKAENAYNHDLAAYQYAKADYDAAKYKYEAVRSHEGAHVHGAKEAFDRFAETLAKTYSQYESSSTLLKDAQAKVDQFLAETKELERSQRRLEMDANILERKLETVDFQAMSVANKLGNVIRDLPIMNMLAPYYKVDQIVLQDIREDLNFAKVPTVDRCTTCHKGIVKPGFEDSPQPYTTHPRLDLFLASDSPHPMEKFGCTSCHAGRGRGTSFNATAHTPASDEQAKEWAEKYDWHAMHHWDKPMLPSKYMEASCFKCHSEQTVVPGADQLNLGMALIERAGCFGCHKIEKYEGRKPTGPNLAHLDSKLLSKDWAYNWIRDPKSFRSHTWMPSFFGQTNNSDEASLRRSEQEIHAIVAYLYGHSSALESSELPVSGDPVKGEELVASVGCMGCHENSHDASREKALSLQALRVEQGPNLIGLGSKVSGQWLYGWLKNPSSYHATTKMPNLRLTDQEAADITSYLLQDRNVSFEQKTVPAVDEAVVDEIARTYLSKTMTAPQVDEQLETMSLDDKLLYSGEKLIGQYGCYACHEIKGFDKAMPIGVELTEIASKSVHKFDFGFLHHLDHTKQAWFTQKVSDPRAFDQGKVLKADEKLVMPNFNMSAGQVDAVVTALMGFVKQDSSVLKPEKTVQAEFVHKGQALVRELNCQGCHMIEGDGAAIQPAVADWLVKHQGKLENDAKALSLSFSPPNLVGEGKKVQSEWLFNFLHDPITIRPWLHVRMPSYHLDESKSNTLVKYFSYLDNQEFPFVSKHVASADSLAAGAKLFSPDYFDCGNCHIQGDKYPQGSPDRWAPDFGLAGKRLKPEWVVEWMYDPQKLLPGTKMPTYFDPEYFDYSGPEDVLDGDEHKQIRALRDYVMQPAKGADS